MAGDHGSIEYGPLLFFLNRLDLEVIIIQQEDRLRFNFASRVFIRVVSVVRLRSIRLVFGIIKLKIGIVIEEGLGIGGKLRDGKIGKVGVVERVGKSWVIILIISIIGLSHLLIFYY